MLPHVKIWAFFILGALVALIIALYSRLEKTEGVLADTSDRLLDAEAKGRYFQGQYERELRRNRKS